MPPRHRSVLTDRAADGPGRTRRWLIGITMLCGAEVLVVIVLGAGTAAFLSRDAILLGGLLLAIVVTTALGRRRRAAFARRPPT